MGSFETDVQIPDLRKTPLRMSSVVLSSQRVPATAKKNSGPHPLVQDQTELVPNITHVFTQDQHLYLQYEVYDAAKGKVASTTTATVASAGNNANAGSSASLNATASPTASQPASSAQPALNSSP